VRPCASQLGMKKSSTTSDSSNLIVRDLGAVDQKRGKLDLIGFTTEEMYSHLTCRHCKEAVKCYDLRFQAAEGLVIPGPGPEKVNGERR